MSMAAEPYSFVPPWYFTSRSSASFDSLSTFMQLSNASSWSDEHTRLPSFAFLVVGGTIRMVVLKTFVS